MVGSRLPWSALPGATRRAASSSGTRQSTHQPEQLAGAHAEVDPRHAVSGHRVEHRGTGGHDMAAVVPGRERADPGVEQLHGRGSGLDLHLEKGRGDAREPVQQLLPQLGVAVHQRLGVLVVLRGAALDHVAGQRVRSSGEADQRLGPELGGEQTHGLGDVPDVGGLQRAQLLQVGAAADRLGHDRADAGLDVEVHADGLERHHDVAVVDGRVHVVTAHRLQGDLLDQLRHLAGVQHGDALADLQVLGQRAPGLSHEPHRCVRHRLASAGPQERGVLQVLGAAGNRPAALAHG